MNRSSLALAHLITITLAAASAACGIAGDRDAPVSQDHGATPARVPARSLLKASAGAASSSGALSPRRRAALAHRRAAPVATPTVPLKYRAFAAAFDLDARAAGAPGAAVAVIEHGEVTFTHGYGTAGLDSAAPVDEDTIFRVGSMTQPLTAAAALALVDRGKGTVNELLTSAVPDVALTDPYAGSLTMRHLLSNQSGLFDFTGWSSNPALATLSCSTDPATLQTFVSGSLFGQNELFMSAPGALYAASNANFVLAGAAIETESGALYASAMKSLLFDPLGMSRTFFVPADVTSAGNFSNGTTYDANGNLVSVAPGDYDCAAYRPYGYAFSSVSDYARFVRLLLGAGPQALSGRSRAAMESVQVETRDLGHIAAEGYGLTVNAGYVTQSNAYYPTTTLSSNGLIEGYASVFYTFPETGFGVVVMSNDSSATFGDSLDLAVTSFAGLPRAAPLPKDTFSVPGKFSRYAGTYVDPSGSFGRIVVSDEGGALTVAFPDADALGISYWPQLSPVLDDSFLITLYGYPYVLEFRGDARGGYSYALIDDAITATRESPDAGP